MPSAQWASLSYVLCPEERQTLYTYDCYGSMLLLQSCCTAFELRTVSSLWCYQSIIKFPFKVLCRLQPPFDVR